MDLAGTEVDLKPFGHSHISNAVRNVWTAGKLIIQGPSFGGGVATENRRNI